MPQVPKDLSSISMLITSNSTPDWKAEDHTRPSFGPYKLTPEGCFFAPEGGIQGDGSKATAAVRKISGPFQVLAESRDARSNAWGLELVWRDRDGQAHDVIIGRDQAIGDGTELARTLAAGGLWVSPSLADRRHLACFLAGVSVPTRKRVVETIGWSGESYVLPEETFGEANDQIRLGQCEDHPFLLRGTLQDWQDQVAKHAPGNSRLTLALSAAFAAPLLYKLGMDSFVLNLYGRSSTGKTTCALAAGSVWGGPVFKESWRATSNGLEAVAMAHQDSLLVLDEQGQCLPGEAGATAYMLANGVDKVRSQKNLKAVKRRSWRVLVLSTGETTLADHLRLDGGVSRAGHDVRFIEVPVLPEGKDQAFEHSGSHESTRELTIHLRTATRLAYGHAARAFLRQLAGLGPHDWLKIEDQIQQWTRRHTPPEANSQVARVVERFALIAVAGSLAQVWGIVPWDPSTASDGAVACLRSWVTARGGLEAGEHLRGIRSIQAFLHLHGTSRFQSVEEPHAKIRDSAGYRKDEEGRTLFMFTTTGWKEACGTEDPYAVAAKCLTVGILQGCGEKGKHRTSKPFKPHGGTQFRAYVLDQQALEVYLQATVQEPLLFGQAWLSIPRG